MKIVLTGAQGQLGQTLQQTLASHQLLPLTRSDLDISDENAVNQMLSDLRPDAIINAAAYTAVDAAETDDMTARAANATGPKNLARWAAKNQVYLIHLSTDFVFSGTSSRPYTPDDQTDPLSIYGRSKLEGELHARYLAPEHCLVLRTSWVYSQFGSNFLKTMLRLMAEKDSLSVVADQIGTPSSTWGLARCIDACLQQKPSGILHWTDAGVASWYDFAVAIQDEALAAGLLSRAIPVRPIKSTDYPTAARRPAFSVLDKSKTVQALGCEQVHWRHELQQVMRAIQAAP